MKMLAVIATIHRVASLRRMTPRPRGEMDPADRRKIAKAAQAVAEAQAAHRSAVLAAMEHGASFAEVAAATGLSTNTLQRWKREAAGDGDD